MVAPELKHEETGKETFSDDGQDLQPLVYTEEELDAMRQVKTKLMEEDGIEESRIGLTFLAVATINCKLRVDDTANRLQKVLELMETLGCPDGINDELWKPDAVHELAAYAPCGKDYKDVISLRQGITFVIDVSKSPPPPKIGNEKALQNLYQAFPQRPQAIMIAGTNAFTRVIVNASIKVASFFSKQKVLDRISFVTVEQAKNSVPLASAPKYVGGQAGGLENIQDWVKERLANFPKPEL